MVLPNRERRDGRHGFSELRDPSPSVQLQAQVFQRGNPLLTPVPGDSRLAGHALYPPEATRSPSSQNFPAPRRAPQRHAAGCPGPAPSCPLSAGAGFQAPSRTHWV